jgi:hypothetical protein
VILTSLFKTTYVLEWITLMLFLSFVSLVGIVTRRQILLKGGLSYA